MLTGSVSDAARNLNRTQPSVSSTLAALEDQLGMRLFNRKGGRLHPVSEAHYLLEECSQLLDRADNLRQNMRSLRTLESGRLDIVSMPGPSVFLLPELLAHFLEHKPEVGCELVSRSTDAVHQLIAAQQFDLGLADRVATSDNSSSLVSQEIYRFDCLCAMASDDRLASEATISPQMLDNKPLACLFGSHPVTQELKAGFQAADCRANIRFSTQYFLPLIRFVKHRLAYGIVDPIAVDSYLDTQQEGTQVVFRPLAVPVGHEIVLLKPSFRAHSLIATEFIDALRHKLLLINARRIAEEDVAPSE